MEDLRNGHPLERCLKAIMFTCSHPQAAAFNTTLAQMDKPNLQTILVGALLGKHMADTIVQVLCDAGCWVTDHTAVACPRNPWHSWPSGIVRTCLQTLKGMPATS